MRPLNTRRRRALLVALVIAAPLLVAAGVGQVAGPFDLSWSTVDSGGGTWSEGGSYALGGTSGQADAGIHEGGDFELLGGFWPAAGGGPPSGPTPRPSCLPRYAEEEWVLRIPDAASPYGYEPHPTAVDVTGDGVDDVVVLLMSYQTTQTYPVEVLMGDGTGSLTLTTPAIFSGTVPEVQHPTDVAIADFNGDDVDDVFVSDHGYDVTPFPGYQNTLILSAPGGRLVDGTGGLPQQVDFTHSTCVGDVDGDDDVDIYVGNTWGQAAIDPQVWVNDGAGVFTISQGVLPPLTSLNQNGFTSCTMADVDNDGDVDIVLGDADDEISNEYSTRTGEILLNDGSGTFSHYANAMPAKPESLTDITHDIVALFIDGDAYIDLILLYNAGSPQGPTVQLLINNQDGTFRDESSLRIDPIPEGADVRFLRMRDLDRDGRLDLLAWSDDYLNPDPLLWLDGGSGRLGLVDHNFRQSYLYHAFVDLDDDGGHDLVQITSAPPAHVYVNRDMGCPVFLPLAASGY